MVIDSSKADDQSLVSKPGHGRWLISQARRDQEGVVGAFVQLHDNLLLLDNNGGRDIQQVAKDLFGLSALVFSPDMLGHEPIKRAGHQRNLQVEVHLQSDHGGKGVEVEELDRLGDTVLDEHAVSVAGEQRRTTGAQMVGQKNGRFLVAQLGDRDLAQGAFVVGELLPNATQSGVAG